MGYRKNLKDKTLGFFCGQNDKRGGGYYRTGVNTCLSFLNEVMASEPFFEERSDAVKISETPYPTNGSGKNLGKGYKI